LVAPAYHQLVTFLGRCPYTPERVNAHAQTELDRLIRLLGLEGHHAPRFAASIEGCLPFFAKADLLSQRNQARHTLLSALVFVSSTAAVCVATFQVLFFPHDLWIILFEIGFMAAAAAAFLSGRKGDWHEGWLRSRYLAEQLRIAFACIAAGMAPSLHIHEPRRTLAFYRGPRTWLAATVERLARDAYVRSDSQGLDLAARRRIVANWIAGQASYHASKAHSAERSALTSQRWIMGLFVATLAAAIGHFLGIGHEHDHAGLEATAITFAAIALPTAGAAIHAIGKQREHERIAERSLEMSRVLDRLRMDAEDALLEADLVDVVAQATRIMTIENYEWWVLLSFNPPELAT
jgi:hypothetical protein